jgi:hypothetical protein
MSTNTKPYKPDKLLKLGQVERLLQNIFALVPSRPTLIGYVESGRLRGFQDPHNRHYYVYQSSVEEFINSYQNS